MCAALNSWITLLCGYVLALVLGDVEESGVLGAELTGGEVADLHRDLTERADDKAGHAPWVVRGYLCLGGCGFVRGQALNGGLGSGEVVGGSRETQRFRGVSSSRNPGAPIELELFFVSREKIISLCVAGFLSERY